MKAVVLTSSHPHEWALLHELGRSIDIAAVVYSANVPRRRSRPLRQLVNRAAGRLVGRPFIQAWRQLQQRYRQRHPGPPALPTVHVTNVNDPPTLQALRDHRPDLVLVSGTNLVGRAIIEQATGEGGGILNLHTGISPYIKGGPNCTNWCLAVGEFQLIGSTVMWLDPGIDTGPILATERAPLDGREDLLELHWKVMEHAHDLYRRAVARVASGQPVARVPQAQLGEGRTFYSADWSATAMARAWMNFKRRYPAAPLAAAPSGARLIPLGAPAPENALVSAPG